MGFGRIESTRQEGVCKHCGRAGAGTTFRESRQWAPGRGVREWHSCDECLAAPIERPLADVLLEHLDG